MGKDTSCLPECACGCGNKVTKMKNKFIHGHHTKINRSGPNNPFFGRYHSKWVKEIIHQTHAHQT